MSAALVTGVGVSRGGLIIGPLVLAFLGLASINFRSLGKGATAILVVTVIIASTLLVFAYRSGWSLMNPSQLVYTPRGDVSSTTNLEMLEFTMGSGARAIFLLMCVAASFLFVEDKRLRYSYQNFLAIFFLLLLIPWTSNFFAKTFQQYLSWRWMWVAPIPVLASVTVGGAVASIRQVSNSALALGVFLVIAVAFAAASPRRVLSQENYTSVRWPDAKLDGDSVYFRPHNKAAAIKNGKLHLEGYEKGF